MTYPNRTSFSAKHALAALCMLLGLGFSNLAHAQTDKSNSHSEKPADMAEEEENSRLPDDSILVADNSIDSLPAKYTKERTQKVIEAYLDDAGFRWDYYDKDGERIYYTYKKDISKEMRFYDRKLQIVYAISVSESPGVKVRMYAQERVNSTHKPWQILTVKTKNKTLNYDYALRTNLRKKFRK